MALAVSISAQQSPTEFSQLTTKDLDGNDVSFEKYKNKCVMVVNTGSGCGLTKTTMEYLNRVRDDPEFKDLEIVAFPSDSFNQEKKNAQELKEWFKSWNAKYDVYQKVDIKTDPVYQWLSKQAGDQSPIWNYGKLESDYINWLKINWWWLLISSNLFIVFFVLTGKYMVRRDGKKVTLHGPQSGAYLDFVSNWNFYQNQVNSFELVLTF